MLKLIKYEYRKRIVSFLIAAALLVASQVYYLIAMALNNTEQTAIAVALFILVGSFGCIYLIIDGILAYSSELRDKRGYMLFMTPNSPYKILGAKTLYSCMTTIFCAIVYCLLTVLNVKLAMIKWPEFNRVSDNLDELTDNQFSQRFLPELFIFFVKIVISFLFVVIIAYFCITLCSTALNNKKASTFLSIVLFFALLISLTWFEGKLLDLFFPMTSITDIAEMNRRSFTQMIFSVAYEVLLGIGLFTGSGWLLDKKLSL